MRFAARGIRAPWLCALFGLAILISSFAKLRVGAAAPLWLDETWTGAIAGQPDWQSTLRQIWLDANAPLYYLLEHLWIGFAGLSDAALRAPSLGFGLAAPILAVLLPMENWELEERLLFGGLVALWTEGVVFSELARCYPLLFCLAIAETVSFVRLLSRPTLARAMIAASLASLTIMTHYQALALVGCQGLVMLAYLRGRVWRLWPAVLPFLPALGVLIWHAPRLAQFARPDVAWYAYTNLRTLEDLFTFTYGGRALLIFAAVAGVWGVMRWIGGSPRDAPKPEFPVHWLAVSASFAAALLLIGAGALRPSFTVRYLTPMVPGLLLALPLSVRLAPPNFKWASCLILGLYCLQALMWMAPVVGRSGRLFNYEIASRDLMRTSPDRLIFTWDHPAQQVEDPSQYAAAGGFFFHRAKAGAEVVPVLFRLGDDPNRRLLSAATTPSSVILWIYDTGVRGVFASRFPPQIPKYDPSFGCRQYGAGSIGIYACARRWAK